MPTQRQKEEKEQCQGIVTQRAEGIGIAPVVESEDVARLQAETKHPAFQERTKCLFRAA